MENETRTVIAVRRYKAGYEIRTIRAEWDEDGKHESGTIKQAFTPGGLCIGNPQMAYRLCEKSAIVPELADPHDDVCTIGFCEQTQKWYGWSHRAIAGFGVGDKVESEDDLCSQTGWTDENLTEYPEQDRRLPVGFVAETLDDARRMAVAFAESVG